MRVRLQKKQ